MRKCCSAVVAVLIEICCVGENSGEIDVNDRSGIRFILSIRFNNKKNGMIHQSPSRLLNQTQFPESETRSYQIQSDIT